MVDVFDFGNLIRVKVKDIELVQVLQVSNPLNVVLSEHENSQGRYSMQVGDLLDLVVIEVKEYQIWQGDQVLYLGDMIVLSRDLFPMVFYQ